MLEITIQVLDDSLPVDGYSQGHISIRGEYGEVKTKGSIMVFISASQLLHHVSLFLLENKKKAELPVGIDSWFEPCLVRGKNNCFSFLDRSGSVVNKSTESELTSTILVAVEDLYNTYVPLFPENDSAAIDLARALQRFKSAMFSK